MIEFKHGLLVRDGDVRLRRFDFYFLQEHQKHKTNPKVARAVCELLCGVEGDIAVKDGLERVKMLKEEVIAELNWYEDLFDRFKDVTPEWLDEHLGK